MKFKNFDELLHTRIVCDSELKAKELLKEAKRQGYTWNTGNDLDEFCYWDDLKENTYYEFWDFKKVTYGNKTLYDGEKYNLINFEDVLEIEGENVLNRDKQNIIDLINELDNLKQQRDKIDSDINELAEVIERSVREFSNK